MNPIRKGLIAFALVGSTLTGGALGAALMNGTANAATTGSSTASSSSGSAVTAPSGKFTPNEDATHEASESPAREAQEDAGQFPTVP